MLTIASVPLKIQYSCELTSYLRMSTDFSGWTVCGYVSEPGGACSEEECNYVAILFRFICITTIIRYAST